MTKLRWPVLGHLRNILVDLCGTEACPDIEIKTGHAVTQLGNWLHTSLSWSLFQIYKLQLVDHERQNRDWEPTRSNLYRQVQHPKGSQELLQLCRPTAASSFHSGQKSAAYFVGDQLVVRAGEGQKDKHSTSVHLSRVPASKEDTMRKATRSSLLILEDGSCPSLQ